MAKYNYGTLEEALKKWDNKKTVWSVEMGGLGPGYEQCIQVMIFEMCKETIGKALTPKEFEKAVEPVITKLDKRFGGFSGAQVGAAKQVAFKFLTKGYDECLNDKAITDRKIQVESNWVYEKP
ncbi:hypothetical protein LCGC14_1732710 [marine sediment metagenome]|uniref:Uncharacterized protein n=1 Tax=marine sediment metagenome TaxID=412755 RepID=A0A0F9K8S2_9ZZZZ